MGSKKSKKTQAPPLPTEITYDGIREMGTLFNIDQSHLLLLESCMYKRARTAEGDIDTIMDAMKESPTPALVLFEKLKEIQHLPSARGSESARPVAVCGTSGFAEPFAMEALWL